MGGPFYFPLSRRVPGEGSGIGWTFYPPTPAAMMTALDAALRIYYENPEAWRGVQRRAMLTDFSWDRSAEQYEAVAAWALDNPRMLESRDPWMEPAEAK